MSYTPEQKFIYLTKKILGKKEASIDMREIEDTVGKEQPECIIYVYEIIKELIKMCHI